MPTKIDERFIGHNQLTWSEELNRISKGAKVEDLTVDNNELILTLDNGVILTAKGDFNIIRGQHSIPGHKNRKDPRGVFGPLINSRGETLQGGYRFATPNEVLIQKEQENER